MGIENSDYQLMATEASIDLSLQSIGKKRDSNSIKDLYSIITEFTSDLKKYQLPRDIIFAQRIIEGYSKKQLPGETKTKEVALLFEENITNKLEKALKTEQGNLEDIKKICLIIADTLYPYSRGFKRSMAA